MNRLTRAQHLEHERLELRGAILGAAVDAGLHTPEEPTPLDFREMPYEIARKLKAMTEENARLRAELADMTNQREDNAAVFMIDRKHQQTGPEPHCNCPSCELHLVYRHRLSRAIAALHALLDCDLGQERWDQAGDVLKELEG
jgi:hypothetical protein